MPRALAASLLVLLAAPAGAVAGWANPIRLADRASEPHIALADDGSAVAVWRTRTSVRAAYRTIPSASFGASSTVARGRYSLLRLSAAPSGRAVALWRGRRGRLYASVREPGGRFGAARRIATAHGIFVPDVKVAANGAAVAVWEEQLRSNSLRIRAARLPVGGSRFGTAITVQALAQAPRLDVDADGDAVVAYYTRKPTGNLAVRRLSGDGTLGSEQRVAKLANAYRITLGPGGHALLAWTTFNEGLDALHVAYAAPGDPFGPPEEIAPDLGRRYFGTGVDEAGNATLFWIGLDPGTTTYHLRIATRRSAEPFSLPAFDLGTGYFDYARLAVNPRGDAIAAWWGDVGQRFRHLAAVRRGPTGPWSATTVLGSAAQGNDFAPDVSIDGTGHGVAVWLANPDRTRRGVGRVFYADYAPD
jgi:hypothetical protein